MHDSEPPLPSLVAKVELERSPLSTREATLTAPGLLEERREGMPSTEPTREWVSTLLGHRVVRVVSCVEPRTELGRGENFICFVKSGHLGFGSSFVGVGLFGSFATVEREE
jgi:hypothetical protein